MYLKTILFLYKYKRLVITRYIARIVDGIQMTFSLHAVDNFL